MKKLLTSLATITLIGGSVANVAAFKQISHQPNINNLTPKVINRTAANEDAEDIAGKLFHKTIKLDPNVWLGKNLATDQANFNAFLVKLGILSSAEAQYVTWGNLNINVAGWYWSKADFTVKKDGATATGNVTLNASTGETTAQIAAKLNKETLKFNYDWWNGKDVAANWAQIPQMLANEHLLTRAEASVVIGVSFGDFTVTKTGQPYYIMGFDVNDNNTVSNATPTINVVNDGPSAATRASEVTGTYYLKGNLNGQYADTTAAETDLTNYLEHDNLDLFKGINVILPHVKLNGDTRINDAIIVKDGQAAKTPWFMVDTENKPQILTQNLTTSHFNALVTLTPPVIQALKKDFTAYPSYNSILSSFIKLSMITKIQIWVQSEQIFLERS